jgi:hypothetical protein
MEPTLTNVLITWFFFFALIGMFIIPAMVLRRAALNVNKPGWQYFLIGLAVGFGGYSAGLMFVKLWNAVVEGGENKMYMGYALFVVSYAVLIAGVTIIKRKALQSN